MIMKKNNIFRLFAALLTGCAMTVVSCDPEIPVETVTAEFPEMTSHTVTPGSEVELSVTGNMDWTVSVPEQTLQWFWIQEGTFKVNRISGKADQTSVVVIGVSATEEFDTDRECEVTMTMGGESKVIAKLVRPAKETSLTLYAAVVEDGEIQFVEDGSGYQYAADEAESIDLIWTGSDFRLPVKVESNFPWTIKTPQWARLDVPSDATGTRQLVIYGVPSLYPLEAASGQLQFLAGDEVVKEYTLNIPGCKDIFSYKLDMSLTEIVFNFAGQVKTMTGFIDGPVTATVSGTSGVRVLPFELVEGKYAVADSEGPAWLHMEMTDYDETEGADVLQSRTVTVSTDLNEGDDRNAVIFFLPPDCGDDVNDLFNDSLDAVNEEYVQYSVPVTQLSSDQEFIAMLSNPSDMAASGATFSVSSNEELFTMFGNTRYAYELVYTNQYARDQARMVFTSAVTSYKVYDETGVDMTATDGFFLSVVMDDDMLGGVIDMVSETRKKGYVVMYGTSGNVLAVVECVIDPEEVIGEVADVSFIGESVMYAPIVGATLDDVSDDSAFSHYREGNALVYHLKYTMPAMPMTISIPSSIKKHTVNPYTFRHNIRVNDLKYDEDFVNGVLGGVALVDGGVTIYMEMPEGRDYLRGNIIFSNSSDETILILVCTLDLRETVE